MRLVTLLNVTALGLALGATPRAAHEGTPAEPKHDPTADCMEMMHGAGVTEEGRKAMREFMQSDRAPQLMANMMEMARRMGNGDVMLGMTRMMDMTRMMGMMGGGMMSGQGMMWPGRERRK